MWRLSNSEGQTTTTTRFDLDGNLFLDETPLDSGFISWASDELQHSMKSYATDSAELSESFIQNLSLANSNINNLETRKTRRCKDKASEMILEENANGRLDVKWSGVDRADIVKQPYEVFYRQDSSGDTQLHVSIVLNFEEATLWLIEMAPHPCLLDIINDDSHTALHLAVFARQPRVVRLLLLAGANARLRTQAGNTPLHIASGLGDVVSVKALLQPVSPAERMWTRSRSSDAQEMMGNDLEIRNYVGETALHIAAKKGHSEIVVELIRAGADVDAQECLSGKTALHLAVENKQYQVIRRIAHEKRCSINAVTYAGYTAYRIALDVDPRLAAELLSLGASPCGSDMEETSSEDEPF